MIRNINGQRATKIQNKGVCGYGLPLGCFLSIKYLFKYLRAYSKRQALHI
jgi:hypothetical protein